jgi:stage III sporulation protein AD
LDIIQIVGIGIVSVALSMAIKKQVPEFSLLIGIIASVVIFLFILPKLISVFQVIHIIAMGSNIDMVYVDIVLKIIGISYIAEFGSQICLDAGEGSIASKIELSGKVLIMVISIPIIMALIDLIINIFPS